MDRERKRGWQDDRGCQATGRLAVVLVAGVHSTLTWVYPISLTMRAQTAPDIPRPRSQGRSHDAEGELVT
ncbi:MAG TPA: hypothetical protein VMT27_05495 [Actinomycetes bacterium]|nr:hypothetical protein [Actinomycetes bacterium]